MKSNRGILQPDAMALIEEAVQLLRLAPAATLAIYYAGAVPFVLGLLYFGAHASWFQPTAVEIAWGALGLVVLFAAMKAAQAEFCARLMAARLNLAPAAWSWSRFVRVAIAQLRVQPWLLLAGGVATVALVPAGWWYAYAQSVTVVGDEEEPHGVALAQARLWSAQNHLALLVLSAVATAAWINLAAAFLAVPWLANRLLGIDNIFGFSGSWFLNSTFLAAVTALTWLAVDPLVKAFYVVRVFHGRARRTGADLRVEWETARAAAAIRVAVVVAILGAMLSVPAIAADAARPAARAVEPAQLERAIDTVLSRPEFRWRLRQVAPPAPPANEGPIKRFVRQGLEALKRGAQAVGRGLRSVVDWIERHFSGGESDGSGSAVSAGVSGLRAMLYLFIAVAVALLGWLIWLIVRGASRQHAPVVTAEAVAAVPDLRDDRVQAAQLPADGWIALAREQANRGEWRLALRALYLATLARLATEGLVSLAPFKTNLDYEREVRRRALSRQEVAAQFARRRREFEAVWYGRTEPGEGAVRAWLAEFQA